MRTTRKITLDYDDANTYIRDCRQVRAHVQRVMAPVDEHVFDGNPSIYADLELESVTLYRCLITTTRVTESDPMAEGFSGQIFLEVVFPG